MFLIRYVSIVGIVIELIGFFYYGFISSLSSFEAIKSLVYLILWIILYINIDYKMKIFILEEEIKKIKEKYNF